MFVIFNKAERTDLAMVCFKKDPKEQEAMMHRLDIDEQVKEWQKTNSGDRKSVV